MDQTILRVTSVSVEPQQKTQVQAGCSRNLSVLIGDENLRAVQGGDDMVTEKVARVVRLIDRKKEYWESSGSSSDSDGESTDSDDDIGWGSLRREIPVEDPSPATLPTANESDVDEVLEEGLARADRTPSNGDHGEELVGSHDVRRSRCRGTLEGQGEVALDLEESEEVGNIPGGSVINSGKREEAAVSSQVRSSVRLRARSSRGLIVAKQSKFTDFEVESPSKHGKHQNEAPSHRIVNGREPQPKREHNFVCPTCTKAFSCKFRFNRHIQSRHSNIRPFQCPHCPARFKLRNILTRHMVVHSEQKPFKCPKCPARFRRKSDEKSHMLHLHSNRRPFKCQVCEAGFKLKHKLTIHLRIHTGERPYSCHICNKTFSQGGTLKQHMRTHLGEEGKIHQCPFCSMKFADMSNCRAHQRRHHKSELGSEAVATKN